MTSPKNRLKWWYLTNKLNLLLALSSLEHKLWVRATRLVMRGIKLYFNRMTYYNEKVEGLDYGSFRLMYTWVVLNIWSELYWFSVHNANLKYGIERYVEPDNKKGEQKK
jgi:hypothetical protein